MKNPVVVNGHLLSSLSAHFTENNQLYFDIGWMKPGRHVYCVSHNQTFYVHEMLAGLRNDDIPIAYKERHTKAVTRAMFKPKPVFANWALDDHEILRRCYDYDGKCIPFQEITYDKQDMSTLTRSISMKYKNLKQVFHYLQGMTKSYPRIDMKTLKDHFLLKLNIDLRAININKVDVIVQSIHIAEARRQRAEIDQKPLGDEPLVRV